MAKLLAFSGRVGSAATCRSVHTRNLARVSSSPQHRLLARPVSGVQTHSRKSSFTINAASENLPVPFPDPDNAREAIQSGLALTKLQQWPEALSMFESSLSLPGTGLKRYRDKPNELSEGEKMTALYNIACCHSKLGDARSGLVALAGCLEAGYGNFEQLRKDPDLAFLREDPKFEGLLQRFQPARGGLDLFGIFGGRN